MLKKVVPVLCALMLIVSVAGSEEPSPPSAVSPGIPSRQVRILANQSVLLDATGDIKRVSVAKPEVADVMVVSPRQILVSGKMTGMTTLIYWDDQERPTPVDLLVGGFTGQIKEELAKVAPGETFDVTLSGDSLSLTGMVADETMKARLGEGAKIYAKNVVNLLKARRQEQVLLQVRVSEVDRTMAKELGFNMLFQPFINGGQYRGSLNAPNSFAPNFDQLNPPPGQAPGPNQAFSDMTNLFVQTPGFFNAKFTGFLRILHDKGALKTLAEPNLVVASGGEGKFLVGGEFPIVYSSGSGGGTSYSIVYKEFGVRLNFQPKVADNGEIYVKVSQEVSELDFANAVILSGFRIPALKSRKAESALQLADGQTFVIAGLIDNKANRQVSKIPILGDIPYIGVLFRNTRYQNTETELMVMVTPKIVRPLNKEEIPALPTERMDPKELSSNLLK